MGEIDISFEFDIDLEMLEKNQSYTYTGESDGDTYNFVFTTSNLNNRLCVVASKSPGKTLKSISLDIKFTASNVSDTDFVTNANIGPIGVKIDLAASIDGLRSLKYVNDGKIHTIVSIKKTHSYSDSLPGYILSQTYNLPVGNEESEDIKFGKHEFNVKTQKSMDQLTLSFTALKNEEANYTVDAKVLICDDSTTVTKEKVIDFSNGGTRYVHIRDAFYLDSVKEIQLTLSNLKMKDPPLATSIADCRNTPSTTDYILPLKDETVDYSIGNLRNSANYLKNSGSNSIYSANYGYNYNYNCNTVSKPYSSKDETGFVGLQNQGATCYMNSMLQSLYHLPAFRRLTYQMPTDNIEDEKKSIPLNLQRLFCRMQTGSSTCTTTALTQSFGWGSTETFMQHDIQEFCRVLIDNLETKLKGTPLEPRIADLFKGQYRNYIRCKCVPFESTHVEDFYDLQMQVKGCKTLEGSFKKYIEAEELTGDNQYSTDEYGKQDAKMGVEFVRFPTVLQIHLARFEYDFNVDRMVKNNERLEFPEEIDLAPYLAEDADRSQSQLYELFGVLVHSGSASFGHYYAFLRPSEDPQWYKFNDSRVSKATKEDAVDDNYGGSTSHSSSYSTYYGSAYERSDNGYMLVYVRKDAVKTVFEPVKDSEIPEDVREYCKSHTEERSSSSYYSADVTIITEDDLRKNVSSGQKTLAKPGREVIKMDKSGTTRKMLYQKVAEEFKLALGSFRLWPSTYMSSLCAPIACDDGIAFNSYYYTYILEMTEEGEPPEDECHNIIKFFFPHRTPAIECLGIIHTKKAEGLEGVLKEVRKIVGLPEDAPLVVYKEETYNATLELETQMKEDGNIYVIQQDPKFPPKPCSYEPPKSNSEKDEKEKETEEGDENLPVLRMKELCNEDLDTISVLDYIKYTVKVTKIRLFSIREPKKPVAIIEIPESEGFETLNKIIGNVAGIEFDPETMSIILYKGSYENEEVPADNCINIAYETNVGSTFYNTKKSIRNLWYDINNEIPQSQLKEYNIINVSYFEDGIHEKQGERVCLKKTSSVKEAIEKLKVFFGIKDEDSLELYRLTSSEMSLVSQYESLNTFYSYRLQPHIDGSEKMWIVSVAEPEYRSLKCIGVHFFAPIVAGEDSAQTVERLCGIAGIPSKNVSLMYKPTDEHWPKEFEKGEIPSEVVKPGWSIYIIGKKAGKKDRSSHNKEMAVKIYN